MGVTYIATPCSRCGRRLRKGFYVFSRFTGNHYCLDYQACARRRKRALSKREADEHGLTAMQTDHAGAEVPVPAAPVSRSESVVRVGSPEYERNLAASLAGQTTKRPTADERQRSIREAHRA